MTADAMVATTDTRPEEMLPMTRHVLSIRLLFDSKDAADRAAASLDRQQFDGLIAAETFIEEM